MLKFNYLGPNLINKLSVTSTSNLRIPNLLNSKTELNMHS